MKALAELTKSVLWAQELVGEVLKPGDLAVDLTAGNGHDTLFLARKVGETGRVLAFDIQEAALSNTADRLCAEGISLHYWPRVASRREEWQKPGVHLIRDDHQNLGEYLAEGPKGIIANLGYLPGGDHQVTTEGESTGKALRTALNLLVPGGRLAVVVYTGHPQGEAEAQGVDELFRELSPRQWKTLRLASANREAAPYVLVAEKREQP